MPLRPTRPQMPAQASPLAAGRRPAMPSQATTRPTAPAIAKRPTMPPQAATRPAVSQKPATPYGKTRSAGASAFGKTTTAAAKARTLTGAGQASAAKGRATIGPANPPKLTPVTRRGKNFNIREPRQRGES